MLIINSIKNSFQALVQKPAITLFFVLFLIITNFLAASVGLSKNYIVFLILLLCLFLMIAAFVSGWFEAIKKAVSCSKSQNLYAVFFEGVGKNLISTIIALIFYGFLFICTIFLARFIAFKFFGGLDFLAKDTGFLAQNSADIIEYFNKMPLEQQSAIYGWYFTLLISMAVFNFLMLFYFPSMFYIENKNDFLKPFIALKDDLVFTFKNFFPVLALNILIQVLSCVLMLLSAFFAQNAVLSVVILFIYIYFVSGVVMVLFNYYGQKNNSNNGCDCIGEDKTID